MQSLSHHRSEANKSWVQCASVVSAPASPLSRLLPATEGFSVPAVLPSPRLHTNGTVSALRLGPPARPTPGSPRCWGLSVPSLPPRSFADAPAASENPRCSAASPAAARGRFLIKFQSLSCGIPLCVSRTEDVASRRRAGLCSRTACVSHSCPWALPPGPACRPPGRQSAEVSPVLPSASPWLFTHSVLLAQSLHVPTRVLKPVLCICVSAPALRMGCRHRFPRFHAHVLLYSLCFSLSDVLHPVCV